MPTFYNYTEDGQVRSIDDVFVPADAFRQGNLWVWGYNAYGQLGINNTTSKICTPVTTFVGGANWKQISSGGDDHTAAIKTDGTLWTWGRGGSGQLGINNPGFNRTTPVTTFAGGTNWKQVSAGNYMTAAIKTDGTLWTWGLEVGYGNLGTNGGPFRYTPVTTFAGGTNWKQVSCSTGLYWASAIKTDGTLWTWGYNYAGQLGTNDTTNRPTPVTTFLGGTNWKQVSAGQAHIAAIKTDGTLWTWGKNYYGMLGINDNSNTTTRCTPVTTFLGGTNWKQVSCNSKNTTAIKTDGTLWTWGYNGNGQLGTNDTTQRNTPVQTSLGGTNWKQVATGYGHISAIKTDGTLWTWGYNNNGQLGVNNAGTGTNKLTPVQTSLGGTNWKQVATGYGHISATTYIDDYL